MTTDTPGVPPTSRPAPNRLARIREEFLSSGEVAEPGLIRSTIQASWLRSLHLKVDTDHLDPAFVDEFNTETPLALSSAPVLRQLVDEFADEPVSVILTDSNGLVLQRVCLDYDLHRALDDAYLAPGFNYAEAQVGTNGIGTALERRAPTTVDGGEHYTGPLGMFTCAGVPVLHPITGALMGVLDLTSLTRDASPLLLVVARSTAHRIEQQLLSKASAREVAVFTGYLSACKHSSASVLALSDDTVMINDHGQQHFDAADRTALLARAVDARGAGQPMTLLADLPSGLTARMDYRPVYAEEALAGGVFRVQPNTAPGRLNAGRRAASPLPGVAGTGATWQRVCRTVADSQRRAEWLVLEGEAGVGKLTLLRGVHQLRDPSEHFRVVDASDAEATSDTEAWLDTVGEELSGDRGTLVLRHLHLLPPAAVHGLAALLLEIPTQRTEREGPWVAMTLADEPRNLDVDTELLPHFPHSMTVPPLRHHMEDLHQIVAHLLGRITRANTLTLSVAARNQLMRLPWQGNVGQLNTILLRLVQQRRTGVIDVDDLPAECRATSRHQLTQMEALERDAIVAALVSNAGSKDRAAKDLGMSRATIYRRLREFGITYSPGHGDSG